MIYGEWVALPAQTLAVIWFLLIIGVAMRQERTGAYGPSEFARTIKLSAIPFAVASLVIFMGPVVRPNPAAPFGRWQFAAPAMFELAIAAAMYWAGWALAKRLARESENSASVAVVAVPGEPGT